MILNRYSEIEEYFNNIINDCEKCDDYITKKIIIFALIDSLAQETYNKHTHINSTIQKGNKDIFCDFLLNYVHSINYLTRIDPIIAYYDNKKLLDENEINLEYLEDRYEYNATQICNLDGSQRILEFLTNNGIDIEKYKYINLLYKHRSKLVHEYREVGNSFRSLQNYTEIKYLSNGDENVKWKMTIPYIFLKEMFKESLANFLRERKSANEDPFQYSKDYWNWYEK